MDGETIRVVIGVGAAFLAVCWMWRRFDSSPLALTYDRSPPDEPCWTEQIRADGRFSYGRYGCFHADLAEMDARARRGEFDTPA